jgi:hypothetical protein
VQQRTLTFLIRLALAMFVALAIAAATWLQIDGDPVVPVWLLVSIAIVVGAAGPADSVSRTMTQWRGYDSVDTTLKIEDPVKALLVSLNAAPISIPWIEIGLTVFLVRKSLLHPLSGTQQRVTRLRMKSYPRPTAVVWTKNKGLLGRCWRERHDVHQDVSAYFEPLSHHLPPGEDVTKAQWKAWPKDKRMKLSFNDYLALRHFGYSHASPIMKDGRYRGCLVVQASPTYAANLATAEATGAIRLAADNIANLL